MKAHQIIQFQFQSTSVEFVVSMCEWKSQNKNNTLAPDSKLLTFFYGILSKNDFIIIYNSVKTITYFPKIPPIVLKQSLVGNHIRMSEKRKNKRSVSKQYLFVCLKILILILLLFHPPLPTHYRKRKSPGSLNYLNARAKSPQL